MNSWKISIITLVALIMQAAPAASAPGSGVHFNVSLSDRISSRTAKAGQKVHARLLADLHQGKKLVAPAGSQVIGHVTEVLKRRRLLRAEISSRRWLQAGGGVCLQFDR